MDEFGSLAKDFGFRPQGKSAPMKSSGGDRRTSPLTTDGNDMFHDVFGGPPKYTNSNSKSASSMSDFDYDSIFKANSNNNEAKTTPRASNSPVYDKPLYDDDIFDNLPGVNSKSDNIFAPMANYPPKQSQDSKQSDQFEDLFGDFSQTEKTEPNRHRSDKSSEGFDDLIPGFGNSSPASNSRWNSDPSPTSTSNTKEKSNEVDDPFASSQGFFTDPLEQFSNISNSKNTKSGITSSGDVFADMDPLNTNKSPPAYSKDSETQNRKKGPSQTHSEEGSSVGSARSSISREPFDEYSFQESHQSSHIGTSSNGDIWLTVSEIPLFTPITRAPPPSRPPPPIPARVSTSSSTKYSNTMDEDEEKIREIEKEKARQAVERANREARERAANEARLKAERAAVQRAQTEARERAAVEARERAERERAAAEKAAAERAAAEKAAAEKAAAEKAAVAKAQAEARRRAERAAVERVTAEARERAAVEARERAAAAAAAAAAAKVSQQRNDDDLDSFFSMGSQPNTVPKARASSNDSATDPLSQDRRGAHRASSSAIPSNVKKTSTVNFVDDLSSIFGGGMPAGEFQDVEGETEERRRARLERQQRTQERAAKALAEKNQRDLLVQKEQEERHRISASLDIEIKRWASGKEGNLRAMLSTLQYVLWPGCGWQPVALTDLITGASVKKVYRKATLCIHPDKVQQKGANLQQKYVAEKVFDLLKEAWNKFNSEELF